MSKKILIVEDEPDILKMLEFILEKNGFEVIVAIDGPQALDLFKQQKPDLVILDWLLPSMDAAEISSRMRDISGSKYTPVILLTATAEDIIKKAKDCDAQAYYLKPFDYEELVKKVEELVKLN
ncbi:MAG: response regulator [Candidatus Omnitrophota bacterium]|nr:response regulator [Candidatus Omnitrophota bacterium]